MKYIDDQNREVDIKEFGFDPEIIKKQSENYKTEDEKREHLWRVYKKISKISYDLRLILRYLNLVDIEIKKTIGGPSIKIKKKDLLKKISDIENDEITKREFDELLFTLLREKRKNIREIYNKSISKIFDKFSDSENNVFIYEVLNQTQAFRSDVEDKPKIMLRNLRNIQREFNTLWKWVTKEYAKYDYLKSFITEEDKTEIDKITEKNLKQFKKGELKKELVKIAKELKLADGVSVGSRTIVKITNQLIKKGWDANKDSVAVVLRNMGYVEGRRI